jgi:hypothetical protein
MLLQTMFALETISVQVVLLYISKIMHTLPKKWNSIITRVNPSLLPLLAYEENPPLVQSST